MTIAAEVLNNWELERRKIASHVGRHSAWSTPITSLKGPGARAWTVSLSDGRLGVAVPLSDEREVNEAFANVALFSYDGEIADDDADERFSGAMLALVSTRASEAFATLCEEFLRPGRRGERRQRLVADPVSWWNEWKSLLGNRDVNPRVYDVLGELCALKWLLEKGENPTWRGPDSATDDIDCGNDLYEVKSTLTRNSKTVTIHGLYQLADDFRSRHLVFCRFEGADKGKSISLLSAELEELGMDVNELEESLSRLGYPRGKSARDWTYALLDFELFEVDDSFPRIAPESFVGGALPEGVTAIDYTVSLDSMESKKLL